MPLTIPEILSDLPDALGMVQTVEAAIASLPPAPAPRHAVDYAKAFGAAPDGVQMKLAQLIDKVEAQLAS